MHRRKLLFATFLFILVFSLSPLHTEARLSNGSGSEYQFNFPSFEPALLANAFTSFVGDLFDSLFNKIYSPPILPTEGGCKIECPEFIEGLPLDSTGDSSKLVLVKTEFLDLESLKAELQVELESYVRSQIALRPTTVYQSLSTPTATTPQSLNTAEVIPIVYRTITRQSDSDASRISTNLANITNEGTFTSPTLTDATITGATFPSGLTVSGGGASITGDLTINGNTIVSGGSINVGDKIISPGDIGVGTTSPYGKLSVQGTVTTQPSFVLYGAVNQTADLVSIYDNPTSNTNLLTITSVGKVGIGTVSPAYKLDVAGFINTDQYSGYKQAGNTVLYASTTNNTLAVGASSAAGWMSASSTQWYSVAVGPGALATTPTSGAQYNSALGYNTLTSNTTGWYNSVVGAEALYSNTTGSNNSTLGYQTLYSNTTGGYNSTIGYLALSANTTGHSNTAIGAQALFDNTTGDYNNAFGKNSGYGVTTGTRNVLIGPSTIAASYNQVTTGSNNISIGNDVAVASPTASNQLNIGNLIYGTGLDGTGTTISSGNIGIGTTSPYAKLSVVGETVAAYFTATTTSTNTFPLFTSTSGTTTNFAITGLISSLLATNSDGSVIATSTIGLNLIPDNFLRNDVADTAAGLITFSSGLLSQASSTIGAGGQSTGLTISGGATTTGNAYFAGRVGIGTSPGSYPLSVYNIGNTYQASFSGYSNAYSSSGPGYWSVLFGSPSSGFRIDGADGNITYFDNMYDNPTTETRFRMRAAGTLINALSIKGTGLIGIGTTTPTSLLQVAGATAPKFTLSDTNASADQKHWFIESDTGKFSIGTTSDALVTNSAYRALTIDSSGNVGIGTASPTRTLDVVSDVVHDVNGLTSQLTVRGTADSTQKLNIGYDTTSNYGFIEAVDESVAWQNLALQPGGGNVGIGTTSPWAKLSVKGVGNSTGKAFAVSNFTDAIRFVIQDNGYVGIGTASPGERLEVAGNVYMNDGYLMQDDMWGMKWQFAGTSDTVEMNQAETAWKWNIGGGGVTKYRFNSDKSGSIGGPILDLETGGNALFYGSVGIGTTSPYAKLSLAGSAGGTANIFAVSTSTAGYATTTALTIDQNGDLSLLNGANLAVGGNLTVTGTQTYTGLTTFSNGFLSLASSTIGNGTQTGGLTISGGATTTGNAYFAGNVGIGTAGPTSKLHVEAADNLVVTLKSDTNGGAKNDSYIQFDNRSSFWSLGSKSEIASPTFRIAASSAIGTTDVLTLTITGNLGIGTTSPYAKLDVAGTNNGTNPLFQLSSIASFATTTRFIVTNAGNVGIGTTTPWGKLSVAGTSLGTVPLFTISTSTASATTTVFHIDSNGLVGIGTAAPAYALDVLASGTGVIARFNSTNATGCTLADGGTITCTSDERMKKNIEDNTFGLETVMDLRPVLFNWNYEADATSKNLGFLAQDVEILIPKLVATDENGMKSLNTTGMIPILVRAVQELWEKIRPILAWFEGGNLRVQGDVCVDDLCVTKEQFKALLLQAGVGATITNTNTVSGNQMSTELEPEPTATTTSETTETTATSTPEITSEVIEDVIEGVIEEVPVVEEPFDEAQGESPAGESLP